MAVPTVIWPGLEYDKLLGAGTGGGGGGDDVGMPAEPPPPQAARNRAAAMISALRQQVPIRINAPTVGRARSREFVSMVVPTRAAVPPRISRCSWIARSVPESSEALRPSQ